jgi:hypothetical protein
VAAEPKPVPLANVQVSERERGRAKTATCSRAANPLRQRRRIADTEIMRVSVLAVRFASELAALAALAVAGVDVTDGTASLILAVVLPLIAAAAWGRYVAPASPRRLHDPARAAIELVIFTAGVVALAANGHLTLAIALAIAVTITAPATRRYEPQAAATA